MSYSLFTISTFLLGQALLASLLNVKHYSDSPSPVVLGFRDLGIEIRGNSEYPRAHVEHQHGLGQAAQAPH